VKNVGYTLVEKILARATGDTSLSAGCMVNAPVDRLLINDFVGPITIGQFESLGVGKIKYPERILFGIDHRVPPADVKFANNLRLCRDKCKQYGIERFAEIGRHGIGHQLMVEHFTLPGEVALGTDSHSTMYGGLGALACGITSSDAAVIMATGEIWMQVPPTVRINVSGRLQKGVTAKDLALKILTLAPLHTFIYKAIEIGGECIRELSVSGRLVVANMMAEMDAKCCILEADEKTAAFVGMAPGQLRIDRPDADARYERVYDIDAGEIVPLVACPHRVNNVKTAAELEGLPIHQAFLGSCTNGRIEDIEQALKILQGRKVHPDVRLIVVPASQTVMLEAARLGYIEALLEAGAAVMTPSCASCAGAGPGLVGAGERCVSTTNRNFKGRMGSPDSEVYLSSAYVAAAAAVTGTLTDPRQFL
jgi:3-isopropylmalate/(R)-2-methylmalate dehydratase large subunit